MLLILRQNCESASAGMLLEREDGRERRAMQPYRGCLSQVRVKNISKKTSRRKESRISQKNCLLQDDSFLGCSSGLLAPFTPTLRRFGSCESGEAHSSTHQHSGVYLSFSSINKFTRIQCHYRWCDLNQLSIVNCGHHAAHIITNSNGLTPK